MYTRVHIYIHIHMYITMGAYIYLYRYLQKTRYTSLITIWAADGAVCRILVSLSEYTNKL